MKQQRLDLHTIDRTQIDYHTAQARAMQSRELARLIRRLFTLPVRLLGRTEVRVQARGERGAAAGASKP